MGEGHTFREKLAKVAKDKKDKKKAPVIPKVKVKPEIKKEETKETKK